MKILVIQLRRVGDILLTTPVLSFLKKAIPNATIDFLSEAGGASVLETNPQLDNLLIYKKGKSWSEIKMVRSKQYDVVLDFMNNPRSALLTGLSGARWRVGFRHSVRSIFYNICLPVPADPEYVPQRKLRLVRYWLEKAQVPIPVGVSGRPQLYFSRDDEDFATSWFEQEKIRKGNFMVIAPVHRHPIRSWRWEGFRDVGLKLVQDKKLKVYLAWGPGEEELISQVRKGVEDKLGMLPPTSLRQMGAIFKKARLVLTNDSGAMHLAVATGTPTVTIYGPTRPIDWNPSLSQEGSTQDIVLTASGVPCLGCHLLKCPIGHLCMKQLSEEEIFKACSQILKGGFSNVG